MLTQASSRESKKDISTRQHLMERSFAQATRYGFKRARWRRLWRVQIQEYLTAAIQNIKILLKDVKEPARALSMQVAKEAGNKSSRTKPYGLSQIFDLQFSKIAGLRLCLEKLLLCRHATITG